MHKTVSLSAGLTALFAMGSAGASAVATGCPETPVNAGTNEATGHVFEIYSAPGITWPDAKDCAESKIVGGVNGHLATITSSSENQWIVDVLLTPALGELVGGRTQVWLGGFQDPGSAEPGGGWRWSSSEGLFSGVNGGTEYTNWASGEPNNSGGSEQHLALGRYPDNLAGWNDEGAAVNSIGGFIVEYDVPRSASCTPGSTDPTQTCETIDGQTLIFPDSSFTGGDTIKFTAYEFTDPRVVGGQCTTGQPLTLFTDPIAFGNDAQLRIPPYLCGSPKFVVVKVDSGDITVANGAVLVEHETEVVLPDNLYKCSDPILNNPAANPDPQYQDVVVWQSTDPGLMLENEFGAGIYQGAATEATNGCGSTKAKVRSGSYFVVGLHIDFGGGFDYPGNALGNYEEFVKLTRYKLTLLRQSIRNARSEGSLRPVVSTTMEALIALAIYRLDQGNPAGALNQVRQFLRLVNAANYTQITNRNFNGDHLMRGENIAFTLRVKVIPYKAGP